MTLRLRRESALNLTLEGSVGSFRVGLGREEQQSLEVKYFLTHVGLNFAAGPNDALLSELAPVREIFDFESLEFDEIMQRDIDDARVSAELIPYLLDESSRDVVKLFPPIIVVILPLQEDRNRPAPNYPRRFEGTVEEERNGEAGRFVTRCGDVGQEVFEFVQPVSGGKRIDHDLTRLRINTHRSKLVIVDGQHRAMALLAIYRNLKDQWSDERRAPYREYYSEWTPNFIGRFNLTEIQLPIMLCAVPELDEDYRGDLDLRKAARAIFLTLNKTARKVSNSRNLLLDDNDLISVFLRRCLSLVKAKDARSPFSFRIWNVELDQFRDKVRLQSPTAITGVIHLHYMIEHLMMDNGDVKGVAPRSGYFQSRTKLDNCLDRLDGRNLLGQEVADNTRRDSFSNEVASKLENEFMGRFGAHIVSMFERLAPYEAHNKAAIWLERRLEESHDRQLRPILFEGQGIGRVFEAHRLNLREKLKEGHFKTETPQIEEIVNRLDATAARLGTSIEEFRKKRVELCMATITDRAKLRQGDHPVASVARWFDELYQNVLTSVAFQAAVVCGFFGEIERANSEADRTGALRLNVEAAFGEYLEQLNAFFTPASVAKFKQLVRVFSGEPHEDEEWRIAPSPSTFRSVVHRGEMQPDQWPKYKYLLLELWRPTSEVLRATVERERILCRKDVFRRLYEHNRSQYCNENAKLEENLEKGELEEIFGRSFSAFNSFLRHLNAEAATRTFAREAATTVPAEMEEAGAVGDANGEGS